MVRQALHRILGGALLSRPDKRAVVHCQAFLTLVDSSLYRPGIPFVVRRDRVVAS